MGEKRERGREREGEKEASMVTDSIHLNYSNSVKKPVKKEQNPKLLDSSFSSPTTAAVDSSSQESPPRVHSF